MVVRPREGATAVQIDAEAGGGDRGAGGVGRVGGSRAGRNVRTRETLFCVTAVVLLCVPDRLWELVSDLLKWGCL